MQSISSLRQPLLVAVCGDSGSGKTTLTDGMVRVFGRERITHICLDDYHLLDRATRMHAGITALHPDTNNFALMTEHLRCLALGKPVVKPVYNHKTGIFGSPEEVHLTDVLEVSQKGLKPALRFAEQEYEGLKSDVLEIDGDISHEKACELEDCIWAHMEDASHLRPKRLDLLGRFYIGNTLRQSDPLALTQLIILYHVVSKLNEMSSGAVLEY